MKHSIKVQFALVFTAIMTGTLLLCWFLNSTLLERYYTMNKQQVLLDAYAGINAAASEGSIDTDEFDIELQKVCGIYNIDLIVVDEDSKTVKTSVNDPQTLIRQLRDHVFVEDEKPEHENRVVRETENYVIQYSLDPRTNIGYMEMWGVLDNGNLFLIRTALEGIRDSVEISNRFLAYVGMLAVIASGIIIWSISSRITKPILKLASLSERMTNLDFEARYEGHDRNEIGILGHHMNQLSDRLENTISELKTANNELQKDIEKKEQVDEIRKEFLSNVSHELKTPLALIMGYAEGLKIGINDDPEGREFYCDVIMDEAEKMNIMVKKLLTLNQLEFGNDVVVMERFDIVELISNYMQSAKILIEQKEASVEFKAAGPVYVWGDEFKIEEVFMNYFTNALNYAQGEKKVIIELKQLEEERKVRVSVFNTGSQIQEDCIDHVWEKFYKVDKARTREYGGSGVGLSIVKAIMDSMNQAYGVQNHSEGVEFWFELETK